MRATILLLVAAMLATVDVPSQAEGPDIGEATYELRSWTVEGGGVSYITAGGYTLGSTAGQPDAGTPRSDAGYTLLGGFWRPSCRAASVPVTISRSGNDVLLTWLHDDDNQVYYVHRGTTPCFTPSAATRLEVVAASPWELRDDEVLGNVGISYSYLVRPTCGAAWVDTGRRGEFEFGLTAGN